MEPRAELERLVASLCDGPADAGLNEELCGLLHRHPELRDEYLQYMELHALLQWRGGLVKPRPLTAPRTRLRYPVRKMAAALLLAAACVAAILVLQPPSAQATPDVFEQLVELNVDLVQARPDQRQRLLGRQAAQLQTTLAAAQLPPADRELAQRLLDNGAWLVHNSDPVAEADRFSDIADELVARMDAATTAHDEQRLVQLARSYDRLATAGIEANLSRAASAGPIDSERSKKLSGCQQRHARRMRHFAEIVERTPEHSRKAIRRHLKKK